MNSPIRGGSQGFQSALTTALASRIGKRTGNARGAIAGHGYSDPMSALAGHAFHGAAPHVDTRLGGYGTGGGVPSLRPAPSMPNRMGGPQDIGDPNAPQSPMRGVTPQQLLLAQFQQALQAGGGFHPNIGNGTQQDALQNLLMQMSLANGASIPTQG